MITPIDIQEKTFSTSFRGYNKVDVDEYKKLVSDVLNDRIGEIEKLKDVIRYKNEELKKYKVMEETMSETLVFAKQTAEEILLNARNREELLLNQADLKAAEIINEKNEEIRVLEQKIEQLKTDYSSYKLKLGAVMSSHIKMIDESTID